MSFGKFWFPQPPPQSRVWSQPAPTQLYELRGALVPAGSKPEPVFATLVYELREALVPPALRGGAAGNTAPEPCTFASTVPHPAGGGGAGVRLMRFGKLVPPASGPVGSASILGGSLG